MSHIDPDRIRFLLDGPRGLRELRRDLLGNPHAAQCVLGPRFETLADRLKEIEEGLAQALKPGGPDRA